MFNMEYLKFINYFFVLLLISGILCKDDVDNCVQPTKESLRLKCDLVKEYDPAERPVKSYRDVINIFLEVLPIEIELSDHSDQFALTTWMTMNWTDVFLHWNPEDYGGINEIVIDCSDIWTPDLVSLSSLAEDPYDSASNLVCKVNSTGITSVVFSNTYRAYCSSDRTYWPFDEQTCSIHLGSKVFIGPSLNFTLKEIMPDYLKHDKTWIVKNLEPTVAVYKTGSVDNETYSRLEFKFTLKRHSSSYSATFVYPGAGTAVTILAVLWLDVMSPERIYMFALIIFNCLIFLECFTFILPASGTKPPLLVCFFRDCMVMSGVSIVITIVNRRLINSLLKPMWLTAMVRWINEKSDITNYFLINVEPETSEVKENEDESPSTFSIASQKQKEWKIFATCIDRLMFIMYFLIFLVVLIKLYPAL